MRAPVLVLAALALSALTLAGCDTAEERAEAHYQRALTLLAAGDADRAKVEFRNVFRLDGEHVAARLAYAAELRREGEIREAYGQYLRVVEQDPQSLEGHRALIAMAMQVQDFATAAESVAAAWAIAPQDPGIRAWKATVDYRAGDTAAAVAMAREVVAADPGLVPAQMVLIADRLAAGRMPEALAMADAALAHAPADASLHLVRLRTLEEMGDTAAAGAELERMATLFPADEGVRRALIQWHLASGDTAGAEAVLRRAAAAAPADDPQPALTVVQFLLELRGPQAARAELEARIAAASGGDPLPFRRALAGLDFAEGRSAEAIAALGELVDGAAPSDGIRDLETTLAEMLAETGDAAGARTLVEGVLAADPDHVAALKLDAKMAIDADRPETAVEDMRTALAQAPRDPEIMTIMALAHERQGSRELAGERLALAVEYSDRAPAESLRYARFLMQDMRTDPAEGVVVDALRRAPEHPELLDMLGRIHLARRDWTRAAQVAGILREQKTPQSLALATALETASLEGEGRSDEAIELLKGAGDGSGSGDARALAGLMQAYVAAGDLAAAEEHLDGILARDPKNVPARLMQGGLAALEGDGAAAEAAYRAVIAETPAARAAYQALATLLAGEGKAAEAVAAVDAGLAALPGDARLRFLKAGLLESRGDIDGAIALYEALYAADNGSQVIANNLASLLASHRADAASLERAFAIARRLRGTGVPEFQDTYGWILHRRGDSEQALGVLAPAAAALPGNALVQYHLAEAERALGRFPEARAAYERALLAAEAGSPLPQAEEARTRIAGIDAAAAPAPEPAPDTEPEPAASR
jgi:tetratricopeptide (TPR) repeat protein